MTENNHNNSFQNEKIDSINSQTKIELDSSLNYRRKTLEIPSWEPYMPQPINRKGMPFIKKLLLRRKFKITNPLYIQNLPINILKGCTFFTKDGTLTEPKTKVCSPRANRISEKKTLNNSYLGIKHSIPRDNFKLTQIIKIPNSVEISAEKLNEKPCFQKFLRNPRRILRKRISQSQAPELDFSNSEYKSIKNVPKHSKRIYIPRIRNDSLCLEKNPLNFDKQYSIYNSLVFF